MNEYGKDNGSINLNEVKFMRKINKGRVENNFGCRVRNRRK